MMFPETLAGTAATPFRSASETRRLALTLQRRPVPQLTKKQLETRWGVGPDSVRKTLRLNGVDPGPEKDNLIPLTDGLLCEGVDDPFMAWIAASETELAVLTADLLTEEGWRAQSTERRTERGACRRDLPPVIRIGRLKRFRPDPGAAAGCPAAWQEAGK